MPEKGQPNESPYPFGRLQCTGWERCWGTEGCVWTTLYNETGVFSNITNFYTLSGYSVLTKWKNVTIKYKINFSQNKRPPLLFS